jgi:hypothetical protein
MNAPQLTAGWAGVYLQVIVALLVFALGIPALIYAITVPPDLRMVLHRRTNRARWTIPVWMLAVAAAGFLWLWHPCVGPAGPALAWSALTLMLVVITATIGIWYWGCSRSYRENAVVRMRDDALRNYRENGTFVDESAKPGSSRATAASPLDDLSYLGQKGEAGKGKQVVLEALWEVSRAVMAADTYDGDRLKGVVGAIMATLQSRRRGATRENIRTTIGILQQVLHDDEALRIARPSVRRPPLLDRDLLLVRDALYKSAVVAIGRGEGDLGREILNTANLDCWTMFRIGMAARAKREYGITIMALERMRIRVARMAASGSETWELLGLLSHLVTEDNRPSWAGRRAVKSILVGLSHRFPDDNALRVEIVNAAAHWFGLQKFETANKLEEWGRWPSPLLGL